MESDYRESEDDDYKFEQVSEEELESDAEEATKKAVKDQQTSSSERFVRTRSQKPKQEEKKIEIKNSSVDVDALWAEMNSGPSGPSRATATTSAAPKPSLPAAPELPKAPLTDEMITITRTFKFAGKVTSETKTVKATSAEGRDYLKRKAEEADAAKMASNPSSDPAATDVPPSLPPAKRRPGPVKRKSTLAEEYAAGKAKKLNTLDKSRLDWLGFVDKQGINEDLKKHNKSGYLDKQSFLARVDMNVGKSLKR